MNLPRFVLGQISDIHARRAQPGSSQFAARRCRDAMGLLQESLRMLGEMQVDFVAVTGDLLDVPDYIANGDDYYDYDRPQWDRDIDADYRSVRDILDQSGLPYMVLPGNHDVPRLMWRVFDESANVRLHPAGYRIARFCDREWAGHVPRRIDRERKLWEQMLADADPRPQIHLQHYVVTPECNEWYPHTYLEGANIKDRNVASGKAALSLSGHYHAGTELIREKDCFFSTSTPLCEFPYAIRVYELAGNDIRMRIVPLRQQPILAGKKVVFLDRDGVITEQGGFSTGPREIKIIPNAGRAISRLHQAGYVVVVITNQSSVGCGYVTADHVNAVNDCMCRQLAIEAGELAQPDAIFVSTGAGSKACAPCFADQSDAKPTRVLADRAIKQFSLDGNGAFFVGDREVDLQVARAIGATPILVRTGRGKQTEEQLRQAGNNPAIVCDDLSTSVDRVLN